MNAQKLIGNKKITDWLYISQSVIFSLFEYKLDYCIKFHIRKSI